MFGTGYFNGRENLRVFLKVTTPEKKKGFLLIEEVFRKLFNTQNDGHLDQLWVAISHKSGSVRIVRFCKSGVFQTMREDK